MKKKVIVTIFCLLYTICILGQNQQTVARSTIKRQRTNNHVEQKTSKSNSKSSQLPSTKQLRKTAVQHKSDTILTQIKVNENNKVDIQEAATKTVPSSVNINDFAFYRHVVRKNGWYAGIGKKLTKEQASHMNCYYKLSNMNSAGNWTQMQAFDGEGDLTIDHNVSTYFIRPFDTEDTNANQEWQERLKKVCQWVFIGSYDGKTCIQEQGLDDEDNVIYSMVITKIAPFKYFCTYIDVWGRPATMRNDTIGNDIGQANFVEVTRDINGYDVLTKYFDRNGFPAKNRNGSYMLRYERDTIGNTIRVWALNIVGDPMIDDWGYCGDESVFDDDGNKLTRVNIGLNGKPVMAKNGTFGTWYTYDHYGNNAEIGSLDDKGQKCSNKDGVFRYVYGFDEHGIFINYKEYDKNGNILKEETYNQSRNQDKLSSSGLDTNINEKDSVIEVVVDSVEADSIEIAEDIEYQEDDDKEGRFTEETIIDTLNMVVTNYKYDNGVFYEGYVVEYLKPLIDSYIISSSLTGKALYYITSYGAHARTGKALCYKVLFGKNIMGGETMMGVNEFGEPAYVTTSDSKSIAFLFSDETSNGDVDYDEFGIKRSADELDSLCLTLPRVHCIEVMDTTIAYPMGIRNNDIILSYGDWRICEDVYSGIVGLDEEIVNKKSEKKTMTVLRHHPETKSSEIVVLNLKKGNLQKLGFKTHIIYYTQQEKKRLINTAKAAKFEFTNIQ